MNNKTELKNRFPGAKPFTATEKEVFYGRESDIQKLYDLLCVKQLMVLYAKSGIGKSSLVSAGLIPKFENQGGQFQTLAIRIRFGLPQDHIDESEKNLTVLAAKIFEELEVHKSSLKITELPFIAKPADDSLWHQVKLFERNNIRLLLVFDQFEEAFTYTNDQLNFFKEQLFSLFSCIPAHLNTIITEKVKHVEKEVQDQEKLYQIDKDLKFLDSLSKTKVLLVVKDDKLGFFNLFNDYFPDILKDSYKLLPLTRASAQDAILLPAKKEGEFKTPPFTFSPFAIKKILDKIAEKNDTFDPFTLQLTCRYIERTLVEQSRKSEIQETDIPEVGVIVNDFIDSAWKALPPVFKRKTGFYKETIEEKLIAHDIERRVSVHQSDWIDDEVVTVLINEGLLKRDRRGGVDYIGLSHDRLVAPLLKDYNIRKQQQALNKRKLVILTIFALIITGFIFVANHLFSKNEILVHENKTLEDSLRIHLLKDTIEEKSDSSSYTSTEKQLDSLLYKKYNKHLFKIDIFFVDSAFEKENNSGVPFQQQYAEIVADKLASFLQTEPTYVVRKKIIPSEMRKGANYQAAANIIKFESDADKEELKASKSIRRSVYFTLHIILTPQIVEATKETNNYIKIFLKNSL